MNHIAYSTSRRRAVRCATSDSLSNASASLAFGMEPGYPVAGLACIGLQLLEQLLLARCSSSKSFSVLCVHLLESCLAVALDS
eukprot:4593006-Pleurochrysis_carterae.AAC.1